MKTLFYVILLLFYISCVTDTSDNLKIKGNNSSGKNLEAVFADEDLITGKWEGVYDGNTANFVMTVNHSLYFYSQSIDEMNLFRDSQVKGGIIKPIKWRLSENKYLTFAIYDEAKNYEIMELTENNLTLKNMIQNQTLVLKKGTLSEYELDYIKINNYNK